MNAFMAPVHLSATINKAASMENRLMAQCDDLVAQWENLPAGTDARDFIEYEADEIMDLVIGGAWVGALLTLTYGGPTITPGHLRGQDRSEQPRHYRDPYRRCGCGHSGRAGVPL